MDPSFFTEVWGYISEGLPYAEGVLAAIGTGTLGYGGYKSYKGRKNPDFNIAKINLCGVFSNSADSKPWQPSKITPKGVETLVEQALNIKHGFPFLKKPKVEGMIFYINSPGGEVMAGELISHYIKGLKVPTVAVLGTCAASAGYMAASACDKIVAHRASLVGNIGAIMQGLDLSNVLDLLGIKINTLKSGKYKDIVSKFRPMTSEEEGILQKKVDLLGQYFLDFVADGRKFTIDQRFEAANAAIYLGVEGMDLNLVDVLGQEDEAVELLEELGGFKSQGVKLFSPYEPTFFQKIFSMEHLSYGIGQGIAQSIISRAEKNSDINLGI